MITLIFDKNDLDTVIGILYRNRAEFTRDLITEYHDKYVIYSPLKSVSNWGLLPNQIMFYNDCEELKSFSTSRKIISQLAEIQRKLTL